MINKLTMRGKMLLIGALIFLFLAICCWIAFIVSIQPKTYALHDFNTPSGYVQKSQGISEIPRWEKP